MATYMVFIGSKAAFVTTDKRKAKKAFRKTPTVVDSTEPAWGTATLWRGSVTIDAKP